VLPSDGAGPVQVKLQGVRLRGASFTARCGGRHLKCRWVRGACVCPAKMVRAVCVCVCSWKDGTGPQEGGGGVCVCVVVVVVTCHSQ
jgi:hypothetical protein